MVWLWVQHVGKPDLEMDRDFTFIYKIRRETIVFPWGSLIHQLCLLLCILSKKFTQCALLCVARQSDTQKTTTDLRMKTRSSDASSTLRPGVLPRTALVWKPGGERTRFLKNLREFKQVISELNIFGLCILIIEFSYE